MDGIAMRCRKYWYFATTVHDNTKYKHKASLIEWFPVFIAITCVAVSSETLNGHIADVSETFLRKYKNLIWNNDPKQFALQGQLTMTVTSAMPDREERSTPVCVLYLARRWKKNKIIKTQMWVNSSKRKLISSVLFFSIFFVVL